MMQLTKTRALKVCLFCLIIAFSLGTSSNTQGATEGRREVPSAFAPYWYLDELTDSFIQVKNHLATQLSVIPVLTLASGESIKLNQLTIAPYATKKLSLKSQPP